jgi:single-stranded DNA-binding protein
MEITHHSTTADLCTITLVGNLVSVPEIRYSANPVIAITEFTVASHSRWLDKVSNTYKEWTSFHTVKAYGELVEKSLTLCAKGDIVLLKGSLFTDKKTEKEYILADYVQVFAKGFSQEINQITVTGSITSPIQLIKSEQNKTIAQLDLTTHYKMISPINQQIQNITITRPVHCWGNQAEYIAKQAKENDKLIISGKLSYLNNATKSQYIEAKKLMLSSI